MNCTQARALLMAYLDSELDARTTDEIGRHLSGCPACEQRFAAEEQLEQGIAAQLRAVTCPPEVKQRLLAGLGAQAPGWRPWSRWAAAAAAAVALAALFVHELRSPGARDALRDLVAADAAAAPAAGAPLELETSDAGVIRSYLAAHDLPLPQLPAAGPLGMHEVEWLGVRRAAGGSAIAPSAVVIVGRCCGERVEIFVTPRAGAGGDRGGPVASTQADGLTVTTFLVGALDVAVVSRHDTALIDVLASA